MISFSVLIITHGREELLRKCLESLHPPEKNWKLILFANGEKLSEEILEYARSLGGEFKLLESDTKLTPGEARNQALSEVKNDWVFFLDDDAYVLPNYWDNILPYLADDKADVIGGPDAPPDDMSIFAKALSVTLGSPFCTGMTFSRHRSMGKKIMAADEEKLTSCNLWVRNSALKENPFPSDFERAEETVLLQRLSNEGKLMYYNPLLKVAHYRRKRLSELFRPTLLAGFYRSRASTLSQTAGSEVFWLPSIFVLLHFIIFFDANLLVMLAKVYCGTIGFVSLGLAAKSKKFFLAPLIFFLHYFIVFNYGVGFLYEKVRRII